MTPVRVTKRHQRIGARVLDEPATPYTKEPANLRQEVQKLPLDMRIILEVVDTLQRDPESQRRLRKLRSLYDGILTLPNFPETEASPGS